MSLISLSICYQYGNTKLNTISIYTLTIILYVLIDPPKHVKNACFTHLSAQGVQMQPHPASGDVRPWANSTSPTSPRATPSALETSGAMRCSDLPGGRPRTCHVLTDRLKGKQHVLTTCWNLKGFKSIGFTPKHRGQHA